MYLCQYLLVWSLYYDGLRQYEIKVIEIKVTPGNPSNIKGMKYRGIWEGFLIITVTRDLRGTHNWPSIMLRGVRSSGWPKKINFSVCFKLCVYKCSMINTYRRWFPSRIPIISVFKYIRWLMFNWNVNNKVVEEWPVFIIPCVTREKLIV